MAELKTVKTEKSGGIATLTISRPEALNALNAQVLDDLHDAFHELAQDEETSVVILTGEGKAFVAGADVTAMSKMSHLEARAFMKKGQECFAYIEKFEKPVIAAVNGFALGGGLELAMACDIRFASEKAKFGQPETGLGIIPGFGGTQRLAGYIGMGNAKYLIFGAQTIGAAEALEMGLVQRLYPAEELLTAAMDFANVILANSPVAVRLAKAAINASANTDIITGCAYEAEAQAVAFASEDAKEGLTAFCEKRQAEFIGR